MLMASANHLLMVFIGVEMASLPSYALAGFLKGRRQSSEAALKYVVYGGGAAGVMLYGISLLAGKFGTGYLPDLAAAIARLAGGLARPGAGAGHAVHPGRRRRSSWRRCRSTSGARTCSRGRRPRWRRSCRWRPRGRRWRCWPASSLVLGGLTRRRPTAAAGRRWRRTSVPALAVFAAVTATFGNLAAYAQTNLKRLLAYSTIAHAGYMMMGLATLTARRRPARCCSTWWPTCS